MKRVLIANRGEIAVRAIRACHEVGAEAVSVYTPVDAKSLHVRLADKAICIGNNQLGQGYLNVDALVAAAKGSGVDAIHPGYGFLAENFSFAKKCVEAGLIFVGPHWGTIKDMGDKVRARNIAQKIGLSVVPGVLVGAGEIPRNLAVEEIGVPILVKAAAGGGGERYASRRRYERFKKGHC